MRYTERLFSFVVSSVDSDCSLQPLEKRG